MKSFINKLSTLTLFYFATWLLYGVGVLYIHLFEPKDSVMGLAVAPFGFLGIITTPVILVHWIILLYKKHRDKSVNQP